MQRRIGFLAFDGMQALDLFGPADVFASDVFLGRSLNGEVQRGWPPYEITIIGLTGRQATTSGGVKIYADALLDERMSLDTLIVPGGEGLRRRGVSERAASWIAAHAARVRRIAAVCTGIYGIAPSAYRERFSSK